MDDVGVIKLQMSKRLKDSPLISSNPSQYYPNYGAIAKKIDIEIIANNTPMSSDVAAIKLIRAIDRTSPPGRSGSGLSRLSSRFGLGSSSS